MNFYISIPNKLLFTLATTCCKLSTILKKIFFREYFNSSLIDSCPYSSHFIYMKENHN